MIDTTSADPVADYRTIRRELSAYGGGLEDKAEVVALNKIDVVAPAELARTLADFKKRLRKTPLMISAATSAGVEEAMKKLLTAITEARRQDEPANSGVLASSWQP